AWWRSSTRRSPRTPTSASRAARRSPRRCARRRRAAVPRPPDRRRRPAVRREAWTTSSEAMDLSQYLEFASCTDPGMVRSHNEDAVAADPANGLAVLADGMGGYNAGEVASGMATTVITTEIQQLLAKVKPYDLDPESNKIIAGQLVREQVMKANASIYHAAQSQPQYAGMGTTLV